MAEYHLLEGPIMSSKDKRKKRDAENRIKAQKQEENRIRVATLAVTYFPKETKIQFVESRFYPADLKMIEPKTTTATKTQTKDRYKEKESLFPNIQNIPF